MFKISKRTTLNRLKINIVYYCQHLKYAVPYKFLRIFQMPFIYKREL